MNDDVLDSYDLIDSYGMRPKKIVYHRLMVFKPHYQLLTTLGPNTIFLTIPYKPQHPNALRQIFHRHPRTMTHGM